MQTIYVDKPMQGHGLIQAIARVNRVFHDKPAGLVVDYIGVAQNLKNALGHYSKPDQEQTGIDEVQAVAVMLEKYEIVLAMFQPHMSGGFELVLLLRPTPRPSNAFGIMAGAIDWIMTMRQEASASPFR